MKEYTYQWNPEWDGDETKPILKVTKSSLGCFTWCKRQYQHQYIERRPTDQSAAMLKGSTVHNSYEALWNEFDIQKAEPMDYPQLLNYVGGLFPIDDYGEVYDSVVSFETDRFISARTENTLESYIPVANEIKLDAEWIVAFDMDPKYELSRNYTIHLQGIIDRVFVEDGEYFPMELKTGIWKDSKLSNMRGEMAFYKLLMSLAFDENEERIFNPITKWGWYYPESNYCYRETIKGASMTALKKKFARLLWAYEQGEFPTSFYYKKCQHCSFLGICDAASEMGLEEW